MSRVLVTGASGFVGQALMHRLSQLPGIVARGAARRPIADQFSRPVEWVQVGDLGPETDWRAALAGVDVVVHCAARVHMMDEDVCFSEAAYVRSNLDGSLQLARSAAAAGCRRLVFLSSIKVNGEQTPPGRPFIETDFPAPQDAYGRSKWQAEQQLAALSDALGLEVVIVRSPLVYGPGVRANFGALMQVIRRGWPLPLGAIDNRRSLIGLDNLVDLLVVCLQHPAAAGEVFLVSDGEDVSTPELIRKLAHALGRPSRLWPTPVRFLRFAAVCTGRGDQFDRLAGSLQVDASKTHRVLGWLPPFSMDEQMSKTAKAFLAESPDE